MPSKMTELAAICDKLTAGKALERKKGAERLKALLSTSEVLKQLDRSRQDGFGVSWTSVFEAAGGALLQELKGQKRSSSSSSSSSSTIKQPEMYSVVKFVLQQANGCKTQEGKPVLAPEVVFEHITVILADYSHILASEYAFLMSSYFLTPSLWKHWSTPDLHTFSKILVKYIKGLSKSLRGFNAGPISLAIENITVYMLQRIDVRPMKFFVLFKDFFINTLESNAQTLQHMLAAVNILSEKGAVNSRLNVAQFGRDIAMRLLHLWKSSKGDVLKREIIRFFRLQLVVNDQEPVNTECAWQDVLWKLYEVLCMEVGNARTALKLAGDKLPPLWTDDFVSLLGHVCLILLPEGERLNEVSQTVAESQYSCGRSAKRRRIQTGWETLKSNLLESNDYQSQIVWIRVIKVIVSKCDDNSMDVEQLRDILEVMLKLLSNTKRSIVLTELHDVLLVLANQTRLQTADTDRLWSKAAIFAISLVERNQAHFYGLLSQLLVIGKLQAKTQLIRVIKRSVTSPLSDQGLCWLSNYMSKYQLVLCQLLSPSEMELETAAGDAASQELFQQELWQHVWVMKHLMQTMNEEEGMCRVVEACESVPPTVFGMVMAALVCKESLKPCSTDRELSPSPLDTLVEMHRSMTFTPEPTASQATDTVHPTVLTDVFSVSNSLLVEKMELSAGLLNQSENIVEYIGDSLWMLEMVITYLTAGDMSVDDQPIYLSLKNLWMKLIVKVQEQLRLGSTEKPYLSGLLAVVTTGYPVIASDRDLISALMSYVHSILDKTILSQGSYSSAHSSDSVSESTFAIPELPEVSRKSTSNSTGDAQLSTTTLTLDDKQLLAAIQVLVHLSVTDHQLCDDVLSLLAKASSDQSAAHAHIAMEALSAATAAWQHVDQETVHTMLFHLRALVEGYHTDPLIGAACLKVLNKLISLVDSAQNMTRAEKEDVGGKMYIVVNGLVMQLFERKDDTDGSFQLLPMYGVEYRLALVDTLQLLVKADSKGLWKNAASTQCSIQLDSQFYLIKALLDRDYVVRRTAIQYVDVIFKEYKDGSNVELSCKEQEKWFDLIYTEIRNILAVSGTLSEMDKLDEERTRTATLLSLFQKIIFCSPACSKKSLCALFLCLDEENKHIDSELIARVLDSAIAQSPYYSTAELCELSLGYVAKEWVAVELKLDTFPICLFGLDNLVTFYRKYLSTFVPLTFGKDAAWSQLLTILSEEPTQLVSTHLPSLCLHIVPRIANKLSHSSESKLLLEDLNRLLASNDIQMLAVLKDKLPDLLFLLYTSVWNMSQQHPSEPEPNPPHYTKVQIETTMSYLLKLFQKNGVAASSLLSLLSAQPVAVSSLHCRLAAYATSGKHTYELRQRVTSYHYFIGELLSELKSHSLQPHQLHLSECIVSVITSIISQLQPSSSDDNQSAIYKCEAVVQLIGCLENLFNSLLPASVETVCVVVPRMTYSLASLSNHSDRLVTSGSTNLLSTIWTKYGQRFSHLLKSMEPLRNMAQLTITSVQEHSLSEDDGRLYAIRTLVCDGQRPALVCQEHLVRSLAVEASLLMKRHHENILQYRADLSWIVVPQRTPPGQVCDLMDLGLDFPKDRLWPFVGLEIHLVFEAAVSQETLKTFIASLSDPRNYHLVPNLLTTKEVLHQLTSAVDWIDKSGLCLYNIILDDIFCCDIHSFAEYPQITLGGFKIMPAYSASRSCENINTLAVGKIILQFLAFTINYVEITAIQMKRVIRLASRYRMAALRLFINQLMPIDGFIAELIVQCIQVDPEKRPCKRIICKILRCSDEYIAGCRAAYEFACMINELDHYEELLFKAWYKDIFLDENFLENVNPIDGMKFKDFAKDDFPLAKVFESYNRPKLEEFAKLVRVY